MSKQPPSPTCPTCSRDFVQLVRRQGFIEGLAGLAFLRPFRCQLCTHRFLYGEFGFRHDKPAPDRRQYVRIPVQFPISFTGDVRGEGMTNNISMGGCALESDTKFTVGKVMQLKLHPTNEPNPITVEAAVVRSVSAETARLEFIKVDPGEKERLTRSVAELLVPTRK